MEVDNKNKKLNRIIIFLCVVVALCVGIFILSGVQRKSRIRRYEEMQEAVNVLEENKEVIVEAEVETTVEEVIVEKQYMGEVPVKNIDWNTLKKENEDIYAWICVPGTSIDYPVLQREGDNAYYLEHNLDGSKGYPGCIYTEDYNSKDFSDPHTVIYGHNLKDKTMFTPLHEYKDEEKMLQDQFIYIYTEETVYEYQIFAAYEFRGIHLLLNYDLDNEYVYEQYIKDVFELEQTNDRVAHIKEDIEVTKDDKILTLSTCTNNPNVRMLVVGVLNDN